MKSPLAWLWCGVLLLAGCSCFDALSVRSQSPEAEDEPDDPKVRLVGDFAVPFGMFPIRIEAVGLVTGLNGTGSDPGPTPQRAALVDNMRARGVKNPNALLATRNTSLVLVQAVLRPGIRAGDHFDVEVRIPSRSETTSLRGGYLLETRLTELAALPDGFLHRGNDLGKAEGPVLIDPAGEGKAGEKDRVVLGRGRILGGGVAVKSRDLGLVLKPDHQTVFNASRIANAVNRRFHTFDKGVQVGVAKAKTDKFIELAVHPRYKDNIARYVHVVRAIAIQESDTERMQRIAHLQKRLFEPATACEAALRLEAVGIQGVESLLKGIQAKETDVRFYAAESLAYLDRREAAEPLGHIARQEPAFRVFALTALSAMADFAAYEQLRSLLDGPSAETRYGAFRALCAMNPNEPLVAGERLTEAFSYHLLDTAGPPLIHVTRNRRPEVVLFGKDQQFLTPLYLSAGNQIMVVGTSPEDIAVSKYSVREADQKRVVSARVDDVIRAIVELGGSYPDVVQALQEAKAAGALASRFEVDALPEAGRLYHRPSEAAADTGEANSAAPKSPAPELFYKRGETAEPNGVETAGSAGKPLSTQAESAKKSRSLGGFFAKMIGRDAD